MSRADGLRDWIAGSARRKQELLEEAGGGLTAQEVAERRRLLPMDIEHGRATGALLALQGEDGEWLYPARQFGDDGEPLPGFETVLQAFRVDDPWLRLSELLALDPELGGHSILSLLQERGEAAIPDVLAAVREVG